MRPNPAALALQGLGLIRWSDCAGDAMERESFDDVAGAIREQFGGEKVIIHLMGGENLSGVIDERTYGLSNCLKVVINNGEIRLVNAACVIFVAEEKAKIPSQPAFSAL
jgi:hypothetical protein